MTAPVFSRLLLATEHGEFDRGAEGLAFELASRAALPLAAVLPLTSNAEFEAVAPAWAARAEGAAAARREDLLARAAAAGVALEVAVRRSPEPYAEIVAQAAERGHDLLIIRRRGQRSFLANLLVGEMVTKVVAHAPCAVLVVPRDGRLWQRRVLLALDPLAPAAAGAVAQAAALAAAEALPLLVVCVADGGEPQAQAQTVLAAAVAQAHAAGVAADGELRSGRPHQALLQAAADAGADLIVIGRHRAESLQRAWLGGVAQKVLGLATCPVLVQAMGDGVSS
ncbi:MAG: universal stress protein [Rubrivivax sp.]